ncbi:MAG: hypothetical protein D6816_13215 [Bacteroidetes bacterium]|nr:MAG: hypothetical protein D6816_13215 [Bacteroidota bacterium]
MPGKSCLSTTSTSSTTNCYANLSLRRRKSSPLRRRTIRGGSVDREKGNAGHDSKKNRARISTFIKRMVFNSPKYLVWVVLLLTTELPLAQVPPPVMIENTLRVYPLDAHTLVRVDSSADLDFEAVRRPDILEKFRPLESVLAGGQPGWTYWLHFRMAAKDTLKDWMILLKNPAYQNVTNHSAYTAGNEYVDGYFLLSSGELVHRRDGFHLPKSQRPGYRHPLMNALPISLAAGDTADVFLRVQNLKKGHAALAAELRPSSLEIPFGKSDMHTLMGLCMGVTGILAILCLFFFFR